MKKLYARLAAFISVDHPSPGLKQLPLAVAFAISIVLVLAVPGIQVTSVPLSSVGIALLVVATVLAAIFTMLPKLDKWAIIIPLIDFVAIGAFRAGTGGILSLFAALLILPVVWISAEKGRGYILIAAAGTCAVLMSPYIFGVAKFESGSDYVRAFFSPLVYLFAAAIINELARQSRSQLRSIREFADEKERMLQRTFEYASQLEESEAKYRDAERMFRGLWEAVTEQSVIGTDVTGLIDAWNPGATKLLGIDWSKTQGQRFVFDFHLKQELDDRAKELNYPPGATVLNPGFSALVEAARLGEAESREWTYVREDGTPVPVSLSVTKRVDDAGETVGYLFVAADVTQAREVSRLKDEFVGLISHELRTPLSSILGYLELMRDDDEHPLSDEQEQYLGVAERNAHRLLRLVGDLLFTAQVESGKFPLDLKDVELEQIVTAAVESARPAADAAGIAITEEVDDSSLVTHGDPVRLGQVCDNLISNAIKFTPKGGTVTVSLSRSETSALITVRDTGMGIAESELDQLFSRFFRATTATRNAVPGVGLGLTITKAIVTAHHGEMAVTSDEGVGTEFSVTIPLAVQPATV
ncbi:MAG TPA: ATP-binding protein [Galbitalea sp.]|jgi:signal transduction histidine kinase|nr:ATP-binding protein [Galbitalea sp.]